MALFTFKVFCGAVIVICSALTVFTLGPTIETRFFPVVSTLEIRTIQETEDGFTEVHAAFRKLRDCEYIGTAWFVWVAPGDFRRVSLILLRETGDVSSPNRPVGYQEAGPWIIGASPEDVRAHSFALLSHRCHAFWTTTTEFYP
jgi:hypothetical protein